MVNGDGAPSFSIPLQRAWERVVLVLFRTGDLVKWLVLGFAAWLAQLMGGGQGFSFHFPFPPIGDTRLDLASERAASSGIGSGTELWMSLLVSWAVLMAVGFALGLVVLLTWLSSRGRFILLDGLVRNRAEIVEPWRRLGRRGDSLFAWRLLLGAGLLVAVALVVGAGIGLAALAAGLTGSPATWLGIVPAALVAGCIALVGVYAFVFLDHFVVPLMYRLDLTGRQAWDRFFALFRAYPGWFLLYGPFLLLLKMGAAIAVLALVFATCCLAGCLLMIPYLGTVLLLPIAAFFRLLGLEFLIQLEPDLDPYPRET